MSIIRISHPEPGEADLSEVLRYAGIRNGTDGDAGMKELAEEAAAEVGRLSACSVCSTVVPVTYEDGAVMLGDIRAESKDLKKALRGAKEALLFAATLGPAVDRLIIKHGAVSPLKSLMAEAAGNERIESVCDEFVRGFSEELSGSGKRLLRRFSPGYGDLDLGIQKDLMALLDTQRKIGLTLNASMLMSPSKSVTAVAGIVKAAKKKTGKDCGPAEGTETGRDCSGCDKKDCIFRKI